MSSMTTKVPVLSGSTKVVKLYGAYVRQAVKVVRPGEWCVEGLRARGLCALDGGLLPMNPPAWKRAEDAYENARGFRAKTRAAAQCAVSYVGYGMLGALGSLGSAALVMAGLVAWGAACLVPLPVLALTGAIEGVHQLGVRTTGGSTPKGGGIPEKSRNMSLPSRDQGQHNSAMEKHGVPSAARGTGRSSGIPNRPRIALRGRGEHSIDF